MVPMIKTIWRTAWLLMIITTLSISSAAGKPKDPDDQSFIFHWWERSQLIKKMDLTDDQVSAIKGIVKAQADKITLLRRNYESERRQLYRLFLEDQLDDDNIIKQMAVVEATVSNLIRAEMKINSDMMKELDSDQRQLLVSLIEQQQGQKSSRCLENKEKN